jgi:hypothetical protein
MWGNAMMHAVALLTDDQWQVGQEIGRVASQETFVIPPCNPIWKYVECSDWTFARVSIYNSAVLENL